MSVRYSGDTEIRIGYDPKRRIYRGTVVDPYLRFRGEVSPSHHRDPKSSDAYDDAARRLLHAADRWAAKNKGHYRKFSTEKKSNRVTIQRVFHAACPLEDL